jgi:predicted membrane protein
MTTKAPRQGPGRFQWHTGAWFGTLLGSTLWLLLSAGLMAGQAPLLGGIVLGCFLVPNVVGVLLWRHRDRLPPYVAIQCVLGLIGVFGFGALVAMQRAGQLLALDPRFASPVVYYGILPMVLCIMGWFWVVERAAIKQRSGGP